MKVNLIYLRLNYRRVVLNKLKWLPEKLNIEQYSNINEFIEHLYKIFEHDFKQEPFVVFENSKVEINEFPLHIRCEKLLDKHLTCENEYTCSCCPYVDKEDIFNHLTCKELNTDIRTPGIFDKERATRINWIKPIINNCDKDHPSIKYYETVSRGELKKCFWLESEKYVVILTEDKKGRLYLTSAYYMYDRNRSDRVRKNYKTYCKQLKRDATT